MRKVIVLVLAFLIGMPPGFAYCDVKLPVLDSRYICVIDYESGRVLFEKDSDKIVPMASTTKIMTAIVALENSDLKYVAAVSKRAASVGGSTVGLKYGQKVTMEELLYGLMLRSGNDCAIAIAENVSGSVEKFTALMDSKAFDIGAFSTHFSTPHGLDADGHYTTAYDLALITRYAMGNDVFARIVGTRNVTLDGADGKRSFYNINRILGMVEGADGVKTGYTGKAGKCLVSSAYKDGRRVICVILNSTDRWNDSKALLEYGFKNFESTISVDPKDHHVYIDVVNGSSSKVKAGFGNVYSLPVSESEIGNITYKFEVPEKLYAPLHEKQQLGRLVMYSNNKEIYAIPVVALESIEVSRTKTLLKKISKFLHLKNGE